MPDPHRTRNVVAADQPKLNSTELLKGAQDGDQQLLEILFARYLPKLRRWAHRRMPLWARNGADTADLVQDTLLHALGRLRTFEPRRDGALLGYLRRSLVNRIRDHCRQAIRHPISHELDDTLVDAARSPIEAAISEEDHRRYLSALERLKRADRDAIVARLELSYSYEQLALVLEKSGPEAARIAVRRALGRLAHELNGR